MKSYYNIYDIALRIFDKKLYWHHGCPKVTLEGNENEFGKLIFDFGDEIVYFSIYIKDKQDIINNAEMAILNFEALSEEIVRNG